MQVETEFTAENSGLNAHELPGVGADADPWIRNAAVLWSHRKVLAKSAAIALATSLLIAFLIPKQYESTARMMPPENGGSSSAVFAALAGKAMGGDALGGLAASLLGGRNNGALFVNLLGSGTVTGNLVDRFDLRSEYHKRYRADAVKVLIRRTKIVQDMRSGVITLTVTDTSPVRARDMAQAYLNELNILVNRTSTSSAGKEREFIETRLTKVKADLKKAQEALSEFSSTNSTIDLREQTRATVDAEAKLEGELITGQGELTSLEQIYGDANVRVRAAQARVENLKGEIRKLGGSSTLVAPHMAGDAEPTAQQQAADAGSFPPLRQLPRLAVPYADLYREVHIQETVFDLLTQQYEIARIQELRDIPVLQVVDTPGIAEKKSFPPRLLLALGLTVATCIVMAFLVLMRHRWARLSAADPRRVLAEHIGQSLRAELRARLAPFRRPA